jgi:hypothetical protein
MLSADQGRHLDREVFITFLNGLFIGRAADSSLELKRASMIEPHVDDAHAPTNSRLPEVAFYCEVPRTSRGLDHAPELPPLPKPNRTCRTTT